MYAVISAGKCSSHAENELRGKVSGEPWLAGLFLKAECNARDYTLLASLRHRMAGRGANLTIVAKEVAIYIKLFSEEVDLRRTAKV